MKKVILFLIIGMIFALGGTIAVNASPTTKPVMVNIPACPSESAYIFDEHGQFWHLNAGMISSYYNKMTIQEFLKEATETGSPTDLKACPPANGYMKSKIGQGLQIPMGFFDNVDNWMTDEEFEAQPK